MTLEKRLVKLDKNLSKAQKRVAKLTEERSAVIQQINNLETERAQILASIDEQASKMKGKCKEAAEKICELNTQTCGSIS